MGYFDDIDLNQLFGSTTGYGANYVFDDLTDELVERAEATMGYKLPESYKELLRFRNGGVINDNLTESWLSAIYGISTDPKNFYGLEEMYDNWRNGWQYPDIGIPFGETASAGHDMYYMDFREVDENGEPRIVRIDNEMDNIVLKVADNLPEFVRLILANEPLDEFEIETMGFAEEESEDAGDEPPAEEAPAKKSFFGKLFGR